MLRFIGHVTKRRKRAKCASVVTGKPTDLRNRRYRFKFCEAYYGVVVIVELTTCLLNKRPVTRVVRSALTYSAECHTQQVTNDTGNTL